MARCYIIVILSLCGYVAASLDPPPLVKTGDVTIGVVADLHKKGEKKGSCGPLHLETVEEVAAVEWALNTINNQSDKDYSIGLRIYDSCGDEDLAIRQTLALLQENLPPHTLLGVILLGSSTVVGAVPPTLHAYNVPVVITETSSAHDVTPAKNIFTTAPHLATHIQAALAAAEGDGRDGGALEGSRVGVISSCLHAMQVLQEEASRAGVTLHAHLNLTDRDASSNVKDDVTNFITLHLGYKGTVIALLNSEELNNLLQNLDETILKKSKVRWVISLLNGESVPGELESHKLTSLLPRAVIVQPHAPLLSGLLHFLKDQQNTSLIAPILESSYNSPCHAQDSPSTPCVQSPRQPLQISGSRATSAVKAVSSLAAGFRLVQIERCVENSDCLQDLRTHLEKDMVKALLKLSYTTAGGADKMRYTADGRLITTFTISRVLPVGLHQIGEYREDTGIIWTHGSDNVMTWHGQSISSRGEGVRAMALASLKQEEKEKEQIGIIKSVLTSHKDYVGRTWAFTVLSVACVGVIGCLYVAVYVGLRMCDGTISGSQVMGALLLLGVMGTYASCISYVLPPSPLTCRLRAWTPTICLGLCYALLLVKSMHLRALVAMGTSGEASQVALYMSLVFMVGGQVILSLMAHDRNYLTLGDTKSPIVLLDTTGARFCLPDRFATLASQCYLLLLLVIGTGLALFNRNIRRNYNEGRWLLLVSCISTPVLGVWMAMSYMAPPYLDAPTTSVALLTLASSLLFLIFVPKIKVISRQAKEFRHKKLGMTTSISTVFNNLDMNTTIKPPPAFCDPHQLPPGAVLLPPKPMKQKVSCGNQGIAKYTPSYDSSLVSSARSSYRSNFSSAYRPDSGLTPREREINARYPIYEIDLNGCYP